MAHLRFKALDLVQSRSKIEFNLPEGKISDFFGELAFGTEQMRASLSSDVFKKVDKAIKRGKKIDAETAEAVAAAVKTWAMSKGVTHYTHWFQPLTGATAEKHDSFFDPSKGLEQFKGSALVQQEPDASSFPNGGIRSTFEARGYTAWDPSSPIFIIDTTLCIPTIFVAYTGEALDYKAPLLKSMDAVDRAATRVCKLFDRNVTQVTASLGWEQEYFVVDKALYAARPDLVMAGRTVFGHNPARGQQLDDHYFGTITPRVFEFMKEFEYECQRLGIPVMTRHNEVAPAQFECAPMYEEVNKGTDHNQLLKDVMDKVALKHDLKILFHEKPFAGLNGSGKHNNWSLITDTGVNLFQPSSSARENLQFLVYLVCTLKAVHEHADLLRASIASAGNDHRLGANEAPPAIISAFIGQQLTSVLDELEKNRDVKVDKGDNVYMKLGIDKIPEIILDNTDRNRTSPFAFTGNKFEFRAVGSDANVANPMTVLNTIVAERLNQFYTKVTSRIDKEGVDKKLAIIGELREYILESKAIRFEGDGYSQEWADEAEKRGLSNVKDTARALDFYVSDAAKAVFINNKIMSDVEIEARHEIMLENYIMKLQIESRVMGDLALNHILPTAIAYQNKLIKNAQGLKDLGVDNTEVVETIKQISEYASSVKSNTLAMIEARKKANNIEDSRDRAIAYCDEVKAAYFDKIRYAVDKLELFVDDEDWPLVKYRELLFIR
ncbi:MAG: glutamine synthetase III [Reichenbachiella sp.]|uniref:glutamine synthetase III family protein n=1 Tax=Reichenbachiella sp. TaxID=2184521 RepID=UPI002965DC9D|nr:glutamine synthetase III [Reichenbachiella sp.]MDW3210396.1 glutamine synthetase III [Reichenbachiella sp.]